MKANATYFVVWDELATKPLLFKATDLTVPFAPEARWKITVIAAYRTTTSSTTTVTTSTTK